MNYEAFDSSGTDDDLPPPHQNRISSGVRVAGNGRPAVVGSVPYNRIYGETDIHVQIHQLEQEAYSSVLRAFKAQADAITWEKESLITELRKELRLSNEEHRELLGRVDADGVIQRIREWRQAGGVQTGMMSTGQAVNDPVPSPTVSASRKKQKMTRALSSQSFGGPSSSFPPPALFPANQPLSAAKRGPAKGVKGKKNKPYPASKSAGRGQAVNRVTSASLVSQSAEAANSDPFIGKKVRMRWPDDNNFYEAVITDYNPAEGQHAVVYERGTENETWECVNLSEISPEDIQWVGENPGVSYQGGFAGSDFGRNRSLGHLGFPRGGRGRGGRGMFKGQFKNNFPPSQNGIGKEAPYDIEILHTDTLIKEVERVFRSGNPNPAQAEKAKSVLKEHEQALMDAIQRLADLSDDEVSG